MRAVQLREAKNWSQETLAQKAGLSTKTVSRFENGVHEGRTGTVQKLAKALGVNQYDITGPPPAPLGLVDQAPAEGGIAERLDAIEQALADARSERVQHAADIQKLLKRQDGILKRIEDAIAREEDAAKALAGEGEKWAARVAALARQEFEADARTREAEPGKLAT